MSCNRLQQADAANVHALAAHGQVIAARIGVAGGDSGDNLRERDVKLQQFARDPLRRRIRECCRRIRRRQ